MRKKDRIVNLEPPRNVDHRIPLFERLGRLIDKALDIVVLVQTLVVLGGLAGIAYVAFRWAEFFLSQGGYFRGGLVITLSAILTIGLFARIRIAVAMILVGGAICGVSLITGAIHALLP